MAKLRVYAILTCAVLAAFALADFWPQGDPRSGGMRDVMLLYLGGKDHYTAADLLPYVAYLDKSRGGRPLDWFYDSYLVMMYGGSPSGAPYIDGATDLNDWRFYIDTLFAPGKNLAALDAAISEAAKTLGPPKKPVPVILMIPYPNQKMTDFGDPDGGGRSLDLSRLDDASHAVAWLIDETSRRFKAAGFRNLKLWGYYWMNEGISPPDEPIVKATARLLHDRGFGFLWIPWFNAPGVDKWQELGFDFSILQPNYAFMPAPRDEERLTEAALLARKYNMGIEIEMSPSIVHSTGERDNLSDYLNYGLPSAEGYMSAVHGYYQSSLTIGDLYASDLPADNALYRDLYLFHKGRYVRQDRSVASIRKARRISGASTTLWLDLPTPLRVREVRLHLSNATGDAARPYLARAYACASRKDKGRLLGEATALRVSTIDPRHGVTLSIRGAPRLAGCVRLKLSGGKGSEAVLDWVRVFAAGGSTPVLRCGVEGTTGAPLLNDGLYASSPSDTRRLVRWPSGEAKLSVDVPPDRHLARLWFHAVKPPGGQWPSTASVTLAGCTTEGPLQAPPASAWAAYFPIVLPVPRATKITATLRGATDAPIALDEVEVEPATNLALGKPYTVDPPKPASYPDDGHKLTDGQLSTGFLDGKTVGWINVEASMIVDLGAPSSIDAVRVQVEGGGMGSVWLPKSMLVSTSADGESWTPLRRLSPPAEPPGRACVMRWLEVTAKATGVRFVKLDFVPNCWIMIDEIEVLSGGRNLALGRPYRLLVAPTSDAQYADDGRKLTDGLVSEGGWNSSRVVGYSDADPTVTVDLLAPREIDLVAAHVCGGGSAGIYYPAEMSVETSLDGATWTPPVVVRDHPAESGHEATVALLEVHVSARARYLRLHFKHRGWCMIDEVEAFGPEAVSQE